MTSQAHQDLENPPRVLLAKLGLDGHDRGIKVIARALRDSGMEVVYLGMRVTADQVAAAAAQEDVDVVGISILSGAHMRLMPRMVDALGRHGLRGGDVPSDVVLLVGGTIPDADVAGLQEMGVDGVFPVGTFTADMVKFINESLTR
jgi:methylmalonyl-CoA mutase C-terminal domain/subunit